MERRRSRRGARRKAVGARFKDYIRQFVAFMFSNVGIIGLVVGYTILGALVFMEIEGTESRSRLENVLQERKATAARLWNITCCSLNTFSEHEWRQEVTQIIIHYQQKLVYAIRNEGFDGEKSADKWSFAGAFLYSLTVITTIGYGNVTPHTEIGKMITVLYAIIGMPLFLLYLSNIGDILAKSFKWVYAKLCLCRVCPAVRQRRQVQAATVAEGLTDGPMLSPPPSSATPGLTPVAVAASTSQALPKVDNWQRDVELGYTAGKTQRQPRPRKRRKRHWDNYPGSYDSEEEEQEEEELGEEESEESSSESSSEEVPGMWMGEEEEEEEEVEEEEEGEAEESSDDSSGDSYDPQTVTVPLTLCVLIMVGYVCGGAVLFSEWEEWGILDGSYFCFISLSTIGFGDIVPGDKIYKSNIDLSFIFCSMYLMLGMALIAMCFNLMQEEVISKLRACVRGVRYVTRCRGRKEAVAR